MRSVRVFAFFGFVAVSLGCPSKAPTTKVEGPAKAAEDPWPRALAELRKENDTATCRRVLSDLSGGLAANPAADQPTALPAPAEKALRESMSLADADAGEVRGAGFTGLDAAYLADAFYLRDVARGIDDPTADTAVRADAAFAWIVRQVVLHPWLTPGREGITVNPPLPPTYVLRRGSGSGLERAMAFLALLQQMGLDGCLVGPPEAANAPGLSHSPWGDKKGIPNGPFWAVGVRTANGIRIYDPWNGVPLGTLADAVANPDSVKATGVPADKVKASIPFVAVPLSALAPRMQLLEKKLNPDVDPTGVRLALDAPALLARIPGAKAWNPTADPFTATRSLASFLPLDEGGRDAEPAGQRLYDRYRFEQIPRDATALPPGLQAAEPRARILNGVVEAYNQSFLSPPTPLERAQRGQFSEVTPYLVGKRAEYDAAARRVATDRNHEEKVRTWVAGANEVYAALSRAKLDEKTNPTAVLSAQDAVARFWKDQSAGLMAAIDGVAAGSGLAEATYLLARCKHEQAERLQVRADRLAAAVVSGDPRSEAAAAKAKQAAKDAWSEARDWWGRYETYAPAQEASFPGRTAHSKQLEARAVERAK